MGATTIGEALVAKRRERGLEKGQAAQQIRMSRTTYSSYEQDAQRPSVEVFPALAEFLEISVNDLLALYGETCIVQARNLLSRAVQDSPSRREGRTSTSPTLGDSASDEPNSSLGAATHVVSAEPIDTGSTSQTENLDDASESEVTLEMEEAREELPGTEGIKSTDEVNDRRPSNVKLLASDGEEKASGHKKKKKKKSKRS